MKNMPKIHIGKTTASFTSGSGKTGYPHVED
jgi:hypothetical protein